MASLMAQAAADVEDHHHQQQQQQQRQQQQMAATASSHLNGIGAMHSAAAAAFANPLASDYRERYLMEMHNAAAAYGRSSFGNGSPSFYPSPNQQQHQQHQQQNQQQQPMDSSPSSPVWQLPASDMNQHHHLNHHHQRPAVTGENTTRGNSSLGNGGSGGVAGSLNRGGGASPAASVSISIQSSPSDLYQHPHHNSRFDNLGMYFPSSPPAHASSSHAGVNAEGTIIREMIGRLGGISAVGGVSNGTVSHGGSLASNPQAPHLSGAASGIDKALTLVGNVWSSGAGAPAVEVPNSVGLMGVDPCKGGGGSLVAAINRVGLATSHCLSQCSSDPGFAERAARFSSFSNGNYAQPFSPLIDPAKFRSRSSASLLPNTSRHQLSRTSSCPPLRDRAPAINNSPPTELQSNPAIHENLATASDNLLGGRPEESGDFDGNNSTVKILSRTASNIFSMDMEEGEGSQGGFSAAVDDVDGGTDPAGSKGISHSPERVPGEPCPSGVTHGGSDISCKKRKNNNEEKLKDVGASSQAGKDAKMTEVDDTKAKRYKHGEGSEDKDDVKPKAERSSSETSGETSPRSMKDHSKPSEPPKPDYIHVRARRGQATDSHSLAERVRREKINERMKFLQDLVPGCSKVTGKAVMLDEIINYVQSLQRQVEFLSMKLASVNPRLDFDFESFQGKEVPHPGSQAMLTGPEISPPYLPQMHPQHQAQFQHGLPVGLNYPPHQGNALRRSASVPIPGAVFHLDGFGDSAGQTVWGDGELESIVQMGLGQTHSGSSQLVHCHPSPGQVKVELQQSPISCL